MNIYVKYQLLFIACVLSLTLSAQVSYLWQGYSSNDITNFESSFYGMYSLDIDSGSKELLFALDSLDFTHANMSGLTQNIVSFEFNSDSTGIYFLEIEGELFFYDLNAQSMQFLLDVTPENSNVLFDVYTRVYQIDLVSDSIFYIGGATHGWYNSSTNSFDLIRRPSGHAIAASEFERGIAKFDHIKYKGHWVFTNAAFQLRNAMLGSPEMTQTDYAFVSTEYDNFIDLCLVEYQHKCDSTSLLLIDKNRVENELIVSRMDLASNVIYPYRKFPITDNILGYHYRILDIQHQNNPTWSSCQRKIDLDVDDGTALGLDFRLDSLCSLTDLPLSDIDIEISNDDPLDSIVIEISTPITDVSIDIPIGNYSVSNAGLRYTIISNTNTTHAELEEAIRNARVTYTGEANTMSIHFTAWYDATAGRVATAYYALYESIAYAGDDVERVFCDTDSALTLDNLLVSNADTGGMFYSSSYEELTSYPTYTAPAIDTIYYVVADEVCSDTAMYVNVINPLPEIDPVQDSLVCYEDIWSVSIATTDQIVWDDNSELPSRTLTEAGQYSYRLRNSYGCSAYDTFYLTYTAAPTLSEVAHEICPGDSVLVHGNYYDAMGQYRDTIYSALGCDSIHYELSLRHYEAQAISIDAPEQICEGEEASIDISSSHSMILWNGESLTFPITIDQSGPYNISGIDSNGCEQELTWSLLIHPNPEITTQDLLDTIYASDIQLPVSYEGNIATYAWSPASALECSDCPYPTLISPKEGSYQISVVDDNGCTAEGTVLVRFASAAVYVPNIISVQAIHPINRRFFLQGRISGQYDLRIYDRWGSMLYEARDQEINNSDQGWQPSTEIASGVYVYHISYNDGEEQKVMVGDVTVLR